jgi:hypothetical protein
MLGIVRPDAGYSSTSLCPAGDLPMQNAARDVRLQLDAVFFANLTRTPMTKDELIALSREGKASIEVAYTITRYCVTQRGIDAEGDRLEYPVIFMSISNEDGHLYQDAAYYTDGVDETDLTDAQAEVLCDAIKAADIRH